jgi:dihydrolipoamide dehydrogenase
MHSKQGDAPPVIAVADAHRVAGAREAVGRPIDAAAVFARRDRYVTNWQDAEHAKWVRGIGAELIRAHGRLDGPRRGVVDTPDDKRVVLTARHAVVICTGSRAAVPDLPGVAEAHPWTNRKATDSHEAPRRLAIVGGGGVGVEMASAWRGLGSSVTLIERGPVLLSRMERFVGEMVAHGLADVGVDVRTSVHVTELRRPGGSGPVTLRLSDGSELEADEVLFGIGREPLTEDIGLETVGLTPGSWLDIT